MLPKDFEIAESPQNCLVACCSLIGFSCFWFKSSGNREEYSDMDIFIEVSKLDDNLREKIRDAAWEVGFENSRIISVMIFTEERLKKAIQYESPLVRNIFHEGIRII